MTGARDTLVLLRLLARASRRRASASVVAVEHAGPAAGAPPPSPLSWRTPFPSGRTLETRTLIERLHERVLFGVPFDRAASAPAPVTATRATVVAATATTRLPRRPATSQASPAAWRSAAAAASAPAAGPRPMARSTADAVRATAPTTIAVAPPTSRLPPPPPAAPPALARGATRAHPSPDPVGSGAQSPLPTVSTATIAAPGRATTGNAGSAVDRAAPVSPSAGVASARSSVGFVSPWAVVSTSLVRRHTHASHPGPGVLRARAEPAVAPPSAAATALPRHAAGLSPSSRLGVGARPAPLWRYQSLSAAAMGDGARLPLAPLPSVLAVAAADAPSPRPAGAAPLVPRLVSRRPSLEPLPFLQRRNKAVDVRLLQETVTRRIEETVQRRVSESVESIVARELAPDSPLARRLGDRLYGGLYESLVLEKERAGWG